MKRWMWLTIGIVWCLAVGVVTAISLIGANQAVADQIAAAPSLGRTIDVYISAVVFALPGIIFIALGLRRPSTRS